MRRFLPSRDAMVLWFLFLATCYLANHDNPYPFR